MGNDLRYLEPSLHGAGLKLRARKQIYCRYTCRRRWKLGQCVCDGVSPFSAGAFSCGATSNLLCLEFSDVGKLVVNVCCVARDMYVDGSSWVNPTT